MKTIKQILTYVLWVVMALLIGIVYMLIILGPINMSSDGFWHILRMFYLIGLIRVGLGVGVVIGVIYVLTDIFYLKKKLKNNTHRTLIRILVLFLITIFVGVLHYVLEKVVDVI